LLGVRAILVLDERKAARPAGIAIHREHDLRRWRHAPEVGPEIRFGRAVRQVAYEQTDSQSTLS
jgi:hypothetical protein